MNVDKKILAGIVGGAGYTGGEMLRILLNHPGVEIAFVHSSSNAGKHIYDVHKDLFGDTDLKFASELAYNIDVLFLCVGHGDAKKFLEANVIPDHIRVIDLSQDFRSTQGAKFKSKSFVYGLPECQSRLFRHLPAIGAITACLKRFVKRRSSHHSHYRFHGRGAKFGSNYAFYLA
jgi:N-acetyl-gamma-glutamyl-phosphate reductase